MILDPRAYTERHAYWSGEYDRRRVAQLCEMLPRDGVAIDIGANIGFYTVPLGRHLDDRGRLVAIEAMPANVERLRSNVALNKLAARAIVIETAVGNTADVWLMQPERSADLSGNAARSNQHDGSQIAVQVRTLDEITGSLGLKRCDIVKMDVEGAEFLALRGGAAFLTRTRPVIFAELNDAHMKIFGWSRANLADLIREWGYRAEPGLASEPGDVLLIPLP